MKESRNARAAEVIGLRNGLRLLLLSSLMLSCSPSSENANAPAPLVPNEWQPSLEQVQGDLQETFDSNSNKSQRMLNRMSQNLADLSDARLFIAYVVLFDSLDEAARIKLHNDQEQWLASRQKSAHAAVKSQGGSLATLEYNGVFRKITNERVVELEARFGASKKQKKE